MGKFHVNIYLETSIRGPGAKEAVGEWLVEFTTGKGIPVTRNGIVWEEMTTENALTLKLLQEAMSILTKSCIIRVNTQCPHVFHSIKKHWPERWEKKLWLNAKGKPLGNAVLWQQVYKLIKKHSVRMVSEPHEYQDVMRNDIKKEVEKIHVKK